MRVRTGYSFRNAVGMLPDAMARVKTVGFNGTAPITDRASTFGFNRWSKLAEKEGLKPIFGVELAVTQSISADKPVFDYWTFIAIDDIAAINHLVYVATNQFRYEPLLTYDQANAAKGVFKIVGNRSMLDLVKDDDRTFVALSPSISKGYFNLAQKHNLPFIASSDNKFLTEADKGFYEVVCGQSASVQTYPQWLLTWSEWRSSISKLEAHEGVISSSIFNLEWVSEQCNAKLKKGTLLSPPKAKTLWQMCLEGAEKLGVTLDPETYMPRLERELKLIEEKEFEDYFFIIADLMQWARPKMLCGPARGSSCGSLVCYLLEITTIDPLKHDLLFERFIDITRGGWRYKEKPEKQKVVPWIEND
jgi:DNA polymerase III alpha subunit